MQLGALREPNFRLYLGGQLASLVADGMVTVALAFAILEIGSVADLGLVLAARSWSLFAFVLAGGVLGDRLSRRAVMVGADILRGAAQAACAALLLTGSAAIWQIALLQAVNGVGTAFFNPASTGLVPLVVSAPRLRQANALRSLTESAGAVGGPAAAGVLVTLFDPGWALAVDAASFGISAATLAFLRLPDHDPPPASSFLADLREGWSEFSARSWVFSITIAASLGNVFWAAWWVLGPAVARDDLGGSEAWGTLSAAFGAGAVVGGLAALRGRFRRPVLAGSLAMLPFPLPLALMAVQAPVPVIAAGALVAGAAVVFFAVLFETTMQEQIPEDALSRVTSYDWLGSLALQPLGMALVGPVAVAIGVEPTLWLAAAGLLATILAPLAVPSVWRVRSGRQRVA